MKIIENIAPDTVATFQINAVRGRALLALGQWDQARDALNNAIQLNPKPAETYYLLGLIDEHDGNWSQAAKHYRAAFEATSDAQKIRTVQNQSADE